MCNRASFECVRSFPRIRFCWFLFWEKHPFLSSLLFVCTERKKSLDRVESNRDVVPFCDGGVGPTILHLCLMWSGPWVSCSGWLYLLLSPQFSTCNNRVFRSTKGSCLLEELPILHGVPEHDCNDMSEKTPISNFHQYRLELTSTLKVRLTPNQPTQQLRQIVVVVVFSINRGIVIVLIASRPGPSSTVCIGSQLPLRRTDPILLFAWRVLFQIRQRKWCQQDVPVACFGSVQPAFAPPLLLPLPEFDP